MPTRSRSRRPWKAVARSTRSGPETRSPARSRFRPQALRPLHERNPHLAGGRRTQDRALRGDRQGAGDQPGDRRPRGAQRALCSRVAGRHGHRRHRRIRRDLRSLHAPARARGLPDRDVEPQSGRVQPERADAEQASPSDHRVFPRRRGRVLFGIPPRLHGGHGRLLAAALRRPSDQGLPARRQGLARAAERGHSRGRHRLRHGPRGELDGSGVPGVIVRRL